MPPKVAVIIPTLDRPAELSRAVLSALNQTFTDLEVVVVADTPSDRTMQALEELRNPRLRVVTNPSRVGLADARNIGVRASAAPWLAFLDDDDVWMPDKIEKQLAVAERMQGEYLFIVTKYIERSNIVERVWPEELPKSTERFSEYMFCRRGMLLPSTFFVSRKLITEIPFTGGLRYLEDLDWMLRATADPRTEIGSVSEPLVIYNNLHAPERLSRNVSWRPYYCWTVANRQLFSPLAFSLFITKTVATKAREEGASIRELLALLSTALLLGCFSLRAIFYFFASSLVSRRTKQRVREAISPVARQARVPMMKDGKTL